MQRLPASVETVPVMTLVTTALSLRRTIEQVEPDRVPMLKPIFSGGLSPRLVSVATTTPVADVKKLVVDDPLMLTWPVKVSVTGSGVGVVGRLLISPAQPAVTTTANAATDSTNARRMNERIRKLTPRQT